MKKNSQLLANIFSFFPAAPLFQSHAVYKTAYPIFSTDEPQLFQTSREMQKSIHKKVKTSYQYPSPKHSMSISFYQTSEPYFSIHVFINQYF